MEKIRRSFNDKKIRSVFRIAELHLRKFQRHFKQTPRQIGKIFPCIEPFKDEPTLFEVALQDRSGRENGYIWVSLTEQFPPVPKFSFTGITAYQQLKLKIGSGDFVPVVFTPLYMVAEDNNGNLLAEYGERPSVHAPLIKGAKRFDYHIFKKCFLDQKAKKLDHLTVGVAHKWKKILKRDVEKIEDTSEVD
jgi:hypothetical protein